MDALDALEHQLDRVEAELAGGGTELDVDPTPAGLGPLPAPLRERATCLQRRLATLEVSVTDTLERARRAMVLGDATGGAAQAPRFLDARL